MTEKEIKKSIEVYRDKGCTYFVSCLEELLKWKELALKQQLIIDAMHLREAKNDTAN